MLALIAGTGDLPPALIARLPDRPLIWALAGFEPAVTPDHVFRIETLGSTIAQMRDLGVSELCLAGAIRRPDIDPTMIDAATQPLVPTIMAAIAAGDDGALRAVIGLFEQAGLTIRAAHELAPDLLPPAGVLTRAAPSDWHSADAAAGEGAIAAMGARDQGQACIARVGKVVAEEGADGTDAMLARFCAQYKRPPGSDPLTATFDLIGDGLGAAADWLSGTAPEPVTADDGILFKAPKPQQDRRADLPVIGPATAMRAAEAGLAGIVVEAGGVMVLDRAAVIDILNAQDMFLWVRPRGGA